MLNDPQCSQKTNQAPVLASVSRLLAALFSVITVTRGR